MPSKPARVEEFQVTGAQLVSAVKDLLHQGNIRRISLRNSEGLTLLEIPLVVGLAGALLAPVWAAVGAFAALVAKCTLVVERVEGTDVPGSGSTSRPAKSTPRRTKGPRSTA